MFNDGTPVPEELLAETFIELRKKFGAASWETQVLRGAWEASGTTYQDNLTRFFVEVIDAPEHRHFFKDFKERLKTRFNQLDCLDHVASNRRDLRNAIGPISGPVAEGHFVIAGDQRLLGIA